MGFEDLPWGTITPIGALLALLVWTSRSIASGRWQPKETVDSQMKVLEARLADRDETIQELRGANGALMEAVRLLTERENETVESARATHALIAALPKAIEGGRDAPVSP